MRLRAHEGRMSAQEALQGGETKTREVLVGTEEDKILPGEGSVIWLTGKSEFLHTFVARPGLN